MLRLQVYLLSAIFLAMIFSPIVQTSEESFDIPSENIDLVDKRLELVYLDPTRSSELGLSPAPEGKINLVAQVISLGAIHHAFIEDLGGEITSSFERFNTICFLIDVSKVPAVTYLPDLTWLEADVLERIVVIGSNYGNVFSLPTETKFTQFTNDDEIIVDSLFAMRNSLKVNDKFEASLLGQKKNLTVAAIHTQILGGGFMSLQGLQLWLHEWEDELKSLAGNSSVLNQTQIEKLPSLPLNPISGVYLTGDAIRLNNESPDYMVAVIAKDDLKGQVDKLMELFTFFINLYYGLAAVMAFLIIANTATINMLEREREMATLKTLGTSDIILSKATSAENFVMGSIAGISGIIIGYPVAVWLLQTFTYEIYYVPTYFPSGLPVIMIICVVLLSVSATIPSWIRLRNMNLGNLVRSIER